MVCATAPRFKQLRCTPSTLFAPNPRARGALGDQTDRLEPAGRRFGNFVFAIFPLGANDGARAFAANVADDLVAARPPRRRARAGFISHGDIMARAALKDQRY